MTTTTHREQASGTPPEPRRDGELGVRELARWGWRQLTSMRTALILLLLLALTAIPGSLIPQRNVDALKVSRWQDEHPQLTPIYERLQLFAVYDSPWFAAVFILLLISLVGCIVPRCWVYWRGWRAEPPRAPRNLTRLPDSDAWTAEESPEAVLDRAERVLRRRRYRVRRESDAAGGWVSAERGYLREAGNLLFHLSVLVVLIGFAMGQLFGYKGGVIVLVGGGFSNNLTQYDDFDPGGLFDPGGMEPFSFDVDSFDLDWIYRGPGAGTARDFASHLSYRTTPDATPRDYDLRVNHPLSIGDTDIFLIGHGYAPVFTIRDGNGDIARQGPVPFLPTDANFTSFGVVKVPDAAPTQIGLIGQFYPTYDFQMATGPYSTFGEDVNPRVVMSAYVGDLGLESGESQSVYDLDTTRMTPLSKTVKGEKQPFRVDLKPGQTVQLPDGAGSVTFDRVVQWNRIQISQMPGTTTALTGVVLALLGLLGSLFIRPRRVWVRVRRPDPRDRDGDAEADEDAVSSGAGGTMVEIAALDRSGGGDTAAELERVRALMEEKT